MCQPASSDANTSNLSSCSADVHSNGKSNSHYVADFNTRPKPEPAVSFTRWYTSRDLFGNISLSHRIDKRQPILEITSPQNNSFTVANSIDLEVNVASYFWIFDGVYYQTDWLEGYHKIYNEFNFPDSLNASITVNFADIPYGNHTITVYAVTHDSSQAQETIYFTRR